VSGSDTPAADTFPPLSADTVPRHILVQHRAGIGAVYVPLEVVLLGRRQLGVTQLLLCLIGAERVTHNGGHGPAEGVWGHHPEIIGHGGQRPFWAELTDPDPYLPADFHRHLIRAWGATVWRHLMPSSPIFGFTKDDPIRILAHNLDFWIPAVSEAMEHEMRTWPIVDTGITPGPVRLSNGEILEGATIGGPRKGSTSSRVNTKLPSSLIAPSRPPTTRVVYATFSTRCDPTGLTTTSPTDGRTRPRDREGVVVLRNGATTLTEVSEILGYSNHSAVSKRLARIRDQAARFFNES
jgi:hypothetical protein